MAAALIAVAFVPVGATSALAYDGDNITVSCDTQYTKTLVTLNHTRGGLSYTQRDTSENNNRYNWAVSSNGNALSRKSTLDGETVRWASVAASNYTFKSRIVANQNCNGILPGNGNSSLSYTAKTNV